MKKRLGMLLVVSLVVAMLMMVAAQASGFDRVADELNGLGVFKGTPSGYNLDRAPTRPEAATMLVRLLGQEAAAEAAYAEGTIAHPFTDVADWAAPYVAYLYENGLTRGVSDTLFGSDRLCSAQMYCTFALRALGYSDEKDGDFTYDGAVDFATVKGLADMFLASDEFNRGQLAAVSYQALAANVKNEETSLLAKLVKEGAIDAAAAQPMLAKLDAYKNYAASSVAYSAENANGIDMTMDMTMDISVPMAELEGTVDMALDLKALLDEENISLAATMKMDENEEIGLPATNMGIWMKDNVLYVDDGESKIKEDMGEEYDLLMKEALAEAAKGETALTSGFYMMKDITSKKTSEGTVYTVTLDGEAFSDIYKVVFSAMGLEGMEELIVINNVSADVLVNKKDELESMDMTMSMAMNLGEIGEGIVLDMNYDVLCHCEINEIGSAVKLTYPDFSDFEELDELAVETVPFEK